MSAGSTKQEQPQLGRALDADGRRPGEALLSIVVALQGAAACRLPRTQTAGRPRFQVMPAPIKRAYIVDLPRG